MSGARGCILAISPVSHGFGVVVLDRGGALQDARVKEVRGADKNARCIYEADKLMALYRPAALVLEDHRAPESRRQRRVADLLNLLADLAGDADVSVFVYGPHACRAALGIRVRANKQQVAEAVAQRLPALAGRLPRPRRIWETEAHGMPVFMAASLALTHHAARRQHQT